jgi:hypothetical protein
MSREDQIESAFAGADVVVVVDDWKGSTNKPPAPTFYQGRSFRLADPRARRIYSMLLSAGAAAWHASGSRDTHNFLFNSAEFGKILDYLDSGDTRLYTLLSHVDIFRTERILEQWKQILAEHPQLLQGWDVTDPCAMALFQYGDFLGVHLATTLPAGSKVRIICDRVPWICGRSGRSKAGDGLSALGWARQGIEIEFLSLADKQSPGCAPYLPLLGLVDSEVWAFGRLNQLQLSDGSTIRDRFLKWQADGALQEGPVISEAELQKALGPHERHENLIAYWDALVRWGPKKTVFLNAGPRG